MAETTTYQCPNCNGTLNFDAELGKLKCEYCDSEFTAEEVEQIYAEKQEKADKKAKEAADREEQKSQRDGETQQDQENEGKASEKELSGKSTDYGTEGMTPIQAYLKRSRWDDLPEEALAAYNCSSCGAQLMVDKNTAVTSCPYCGNTAVVPGQLSDLLKPDYVIPFSTTKEEAVEALKEYYNNKKFLPSSFSSSNHIEEIQGVYVPFWLYSGTAKSEATFDARTIQAWSDSENNYIKTDFYDAHRTGEMSFERVPVDGSSKMPDAHMDAIEPFDYNELKDFSIGYLPGYLTERYDLDVDECVPRAEKRIDTTCVSTLQDTVTGYDEVHIKSSSTNADLDSISYALLPVWMLHTRYNDEDYLFAMNGQTGRLIGDLPVQKSKVIGWSAGIFLPLCIIAFIIVYFTLGFGV